MQFPHYRSLHKQPQKDSESQYRNTSNYKLSPGLIHRDGPVPTVLHLIHLSFCLRLPCMKTGVASVMFWVGYQVSDNTQLQGDLRHSYVSSKLGWNIFLPWKRKRTWAKRQSEQAVRHLSHVPQAHFPSSHARSSALGIQP